MRLPLLYVSLLTLDLMNYRSILLVLLLWGPLQAAAQQTSPAPLGLGDTLPPLRLEGVLNHPGGRLDLADYRGRWLILDFWATWCSPCISMFPKTDSLEHQFGGKLAFLPVTYEGEAEVKRAFARRKALQGLQPPLVHSDQQLQALFPHKELPYYVWIDPQGVVRAMTGPGEVRADRIAAILQQGEAVSLLQQKEEEVSLPFDRRQALVQLNPVLPAEALQYSSTLTGYIKGLEGFYSYSPPHSERGARILIANFPLLSLYRTAYMTPTEYYGLNRVIMEVEAPEELLVDKSGDAYRDWLRSGRGYCYELRLPPPLGEQAFSLMQQDLERLFPVYQARVEMRKHPVVALVRRGRGKKLSSGGGKPGLQLSPYGVRMQNASLDALMVRLNVSYQQGASGPLVNLTGESGPVDLQIDAEMSDLEAIRKALQPYGLDLVEKKAKIPVLVIRDRPAGKEKGGARP